MIVEGCAVATVAGQMFRDGHLVIEGNRLVAVGPGPARSSGERIDASGMLATPGLINCHHHLYQHATRGLAQQATLFEWLVALYPIWARIDERVERAAARAGLAALLRSGCTTASDHHYVFPGGDLLGVEVEAARSLGIRFHPCRGAMDLGVSSGGLPPDSVVEDRDAIFAAYEDALTRFHDPSPGSMCRIALAPCSPFSVTRELMAETAEYARSRGVRLHTHMAETVEEEAFCQELFGVRPVEYLEELGWLGDDVWLAHCPSSNARLGAGIAPVAPLVQAGAPVGLGVDGAASNEAGELGGELRQALLVARLRGGPAALTCAEALELGTLHGARCLGRDDELGTLEVGKLADVVLWRLDDIDRSGIEDPVAALVLGPRPLAETVIVDGKVVVERGELRTGDEEEIARELAEVALR
jgi:cytosine/adenosine deaminase-related metal-dependent hydrolase